jgi:hypothetical protein
MVFLEFGGVFPEYCARSQTRGDRNSLPHCAMRGRPSLRPIRRNDCRAGSWSAPCLVWIKIKVKPRKQRAQSRHCDHNSICYSTLRLAHPPSMTTVRDRGAYMTRKDRLASLFDVGRSGQQAVGRVKRCHTYKWSRHSRITVVTSVILTHLPTRSERQRQSRQAYDSPVTLHP